MLLSFITPTTYIEKYQSQGDFILALSHLLDQHKENDYEKAIKATKLPIILDNGLFENHFPEGVDSLLEKALRIKARSFFAPDYLYDAKKTLQSIKNAIYITKKHKADIKVNAVVQGETEEEFFWLYDEFQKILEIDLIGLSILAIPRCFGEWNKKDHKRGEKYELKDSEIASTRIECIKKMIERGGNTKKCHMLGLGDSYEDVIFAAKNASFIVSNDTSSAFWNAMDGRKIQESGKVEGGKTPIKVNFDFKDATKKQLSLAQKNITKVKQLICK